MRTFLEGVKVRGFEPAFVMDIGANRGDWTRTAKEVFPEASFLLIEPQPEMREYLDSLCSELDGVAWVEAGAGAREERLVHTIWEDLAGSSFLPAAEERPLRAGKQREVGIVTVDSLLASRGLRPPDLVKLDVQGFELEALKGAGSLFGRTEAFVVEVSLFSFMPGWPLFREVVAFMGERGYEAYDVIGGARRPFDGALGQVDLAFARREGLLRGSNRWS